MIDLAIGIIIGGAFNKIVTSLVNDIIMPIFSVFTGNLDFTNWFIALNGKQYATLAEAQSEPVATINYGLFLSNILNFLIVAFALFLIIRQINKMREKNTPASDPTTKNCPYCISDIPIKATRCPSCTSELS
jgi:large conductance mechanosensitive channel